MKMGHVAIAVQDSEGNYRLFSKNGLDEGGKEATISLIGREFGTESDRGTIMQEGVQEFLDTPSSNSIEKDQSDYPYYKEAYMIPTTQDQDAVIAQSALDAISRPYNLSRDNCAHTVVQALSAGGVPTIKSPIPMQVAGGLPSAYLSLTVPKLLYNEIKINNPGGQTVRPK